eukprot:441331_1
MEQQQEYIHLLKEQKHKFCEYMLEEISNYENAINELNLTTPIEPETNDEKSISIELQEDVDATKAESNDESTNESDENELNKQINTLISG